MYQITQLNDSLHMECALYVKVKMINSWKLLTMVIWTCLDRYSKICTQWQNVLIKVQSIVFKPLRKKSEIINYLRHRHHSF